MRQLLISGGDAGTSHDCADNPSREKYKILYQRMGTATTDGSLGTRVRGGLYAAPYQIDFVGNPQIVDCIDL